jgi:hypothetical protein
MTEALDLSQSMRATLEETMTKIEDETEEETPEETPEPTEAKPPAEETPEEAPESESTPELEKAEAKPAPKEPVDEKIAHPPSTWTAKAKAEWQKIDPQIRHEIKRREASAAEGIRQYKEQAAYGERISKTLNPYQPFFKSKGIDPIRAVEDAVNLAYTLDTSTPQQKGVILARIAKQYGADLSALTKPGSDDPVQQELARLREEVEATKRDRLNSQSLAQQQQNQRLEQVVADFASETDDTGQLLRPYFWNVASVTTALLESDPTLTLDKAYAIAVEAHPETKALVRAEQSAREAKKRQDEAKAQADKAKKNARLDIPRSTRSPASTAPQGSMRDTIEAAYAAINAR